MLTLDALSLSQLLSDDLYAQSHLKSEAIYIKIIYVFKIAQESLITFFTLFSQQKGIQLMGCVSQDIIKFRLFFPVLKAAALIL